MSAELETVKTEIAEYKAKLKKAEEENDRDMMKRYEDRLIGLQEKENKLMPSGAPASGIQQIDTAEIISKVLKNVRDDQQKEKEEQAKKESESIVISSVSEHKINAFLERVGVTVEEDDLPASTVEFPVFKWEGRKEDDGITDVKDHLEKELDKAGVIGRGKFKLEDIHAKKDVLNVVDSKFGVIKGSTDLVIVPYKTSKMRVQPALSVLWEIKSEKNVSENTFYAFTSQSIAEILAARYHSHQPGVLLVLTDMASGAVLYEFEYVAEYKSFNVKCYSASLAQMMEKVVSFLNKTAVPDAKYCAVRDPDDVNFERNQQVLMFRELKISNDQSDAWDRYCEMEQVTEPCSLDRIQSVRALFQTFGMYTPSPPAYPSMYS